MRRASMSETIRNRQWRIAGRPAKRPAWLDDGRLKDREHVQHGLENAPQAFICLLNGANLGKALLKIDGE